MQFSLRLTLSIRFYGTFKIHFNIYLDLREDAHTHINVSPGHMTTLWQRKFTQAGRVVSYFAFRVV